MAKLIEPTELEKRTKIINMIARLEKDKDILLFGGTPDPELQAALDAEHEIKELLNQKPNEIRTINQTESAISAIIA